MGKTKQRTTSETRPANGLIEQMRIAAEGAYKDLQKRLPADLGKQLEKSVGQGQKTMQAGLKLIQNQLKNNATRSDVDKLTKRLDVLAKQVQQLVTTAARARTPARPAAPAPSRPTSKKASASRATASRTSKAKPAARSSARTATTGARTSSAATSAARTANAKSAAKKTTAKPAGKKTTSASRAAAKKSAPARKPAQATKPAQARPPMSPGAEPSAQAQPVVPVGGGGNARSGA